MVLASDLCAGNRLGIVEGSHDEANVIDRDQLLIVSAGLIGLGAVIVVDHLDLMIE